MTGPAPGCLPAGRLHDIAAGLVAAGLAADLAQTAAGLHVTASVCRLSHTELEVIVDEDLYIELRWWADPNATPAGVVSAITAVLTAIDPARPAPVSDGAQRRAPA